MAATLDMKDYMFPTMRHGQIRLAREFAAAGAVGAFLRWVHHEKAGREAWRRAKISAALVNAATYQILERSE